MNSRSANVAAAKLVVLAGGEGTRMGALKTRILLRGRPILMDLLDRLDWPGEKILITSLKDPAPAGGQNFDHLLIDRAAGEGPMQGVVTAIESIKPLRTPICIVGLDMHNLRRVHLDALIAAARQRGASIAMFGQRDVARIHPLPMLIDPLAIAEVRSYYAAGGRALRGLLELTGGASIDLPADWPPDVLAGINTPQELQAAGGTIAG